MARLSCKSGKVWWDVNDSGSFSASEYMLAVQDWSLEDQCDELESTGMDSGGVAEYIDGVTRFTGSVNVFWDSDATKVQPEALLPGRIILARLEVVAGQQPRYQGYVLITGSSPRSVTTGIVSYQLRVRGTGALTRPS